MLLWEFNKHLWWSQSFPQASLLAFLLQSDMTIGWPRFPHELQHLWWPLSFSSALISGSKFTDIWVCHLTPVELMTFTSVTVCSVLISIRCLSADSQSRQCGLWTLVCLLFLSVWPLRLPPSDLAQLEKTHYLLLKCFLPSEGLRSGGVGGVGAGGRGAWAPCW